MNTKEKFKEFVKSHPELLNHVKNKTKTWQDFYEIYDMYGEEENVWKEYLKPLTTAATTAASFDIMSFLKSLDLDSIKESVNSVQRVIGLIQDMNINNKTNVERKPRPLYKHFED